MSAICLFGALCAVNQSVLNSNIILDLFDPISSEVISTYIKNVQNPSESPCPSIFHYIKEAGEWHGEMTFENVDLQKDINLRLELTVDNKLVGKSDGALYLTYDKESKNNQTLIYKVDFPTQNPVPKVKGIYYNEQLICSGTQDAGNASTTIKLINILKPGSKTTVSTKNVKQPLVYKNKREVEQFPNDAECGVPAMKQFTSLVYKGVEILRGEWPWLVAFYGLVNGKTAFLCGGNLISEMLVITAAHCIQDKEKSKMLEFQDSFVYLGKNNLNNLKEPDNEKRGVKRFIVHPDWNPLDESYDADIAIIVMDSPVKNSDYIIPICVWKFSDELSSLVGQEGSVGGWGLNEIGEINSEYPKKIVAKIIDDETCFRKSSALVRISSDRTFCATGAKDEGLCQGDSGGGLIFKKENKWYLRGLVSASERSKVPNQCDPGSHVVFTDVAKFVSWIQSVKTDKNTYISSNRIAVTRGQYPWMVAFYTFDLFKCGGNLISKLHVIATAHCVHGYKSSESIIYVGKHNLIDLDEIGYEKRGVEKFLINPDYKQFRSKEADIAIIFMDSPVKYSDFIQPISIWEFPEDSIDNVGQKTVVLDWAYNKSFRESTELKTVNFKKCIDTYVAEMLSEKMFCAGDENTCVDDLYFGSGLAIEVKDKWYLRGMYAAFDQYQALKVKCDSLALFTDVAKYVSWIASNTGV